MSPAELAQRALELVRIASPIGHEQALADFIERHAREHLHAGVTRVSNSLVIGRIGDPRPTLALIGHLDTVPAHPAGNPPRIEGARLHGLGASDMKGSLAVMLALAAELPLETLPFNLLLVLYEREEGPYLESGLGPLFEQVPLLRGIAFGVAMEPTDGAVQVGCVGSVHATLTFTGAASHSARPWQGKNAIHAAGPLLTELASRERRAVVVEGHTYYEVMSATVAKGGHARNIVPDRFELNLNYRFAPGKTVARAREDVEEFVAGRCEVTTMDLAPSGRVCASNPHFQRLVALSGRPAEAKQAWTDVARLSELGIDAVNFGPGETSQAHQQNESAPIAALGTAFEVLSNLLRGA